MFALSLIQRASYLKKGLKMTDSIQNTPNQPQKSNPTTKSAMAIAGLVLGIIALLTSFIPIINNISFFLALLGLIFSIVGLISCKRKTRSGLGLAIAALIICLISGAVVFGTQSFYSSAIKEATSSSVSSTSSSNASSLSSENSKYAVSIDSCETASDYQGNDAAVVTYTFTNNSDKATSFTVAISHKAFQKGVQLESAIVSGINSQDSLKEIQPGVSITVKSAYHLDDKSEINVQCSELISLNDTLLAEKSFTL